MTGSRTITGLFNLENEALDVAFETMNVPGRTGVEIHSLYSTKETGPGGPAAAIVRYLPGATVKRHRHPGYELIFVLDGKLTNDGGTHGPGTLEILDPNSTHELHSEGGCTFLVVWEQPVQPVVTES
jgi:anti-sigma factor ChrR (cupin superfamily)